MLRREDAHKRLAQMRIKNWEKGKLEAVGKLPEKLAEASRSAGTYSHWRQQQQPLQMGRLPRRLLAQENFLEDLLGVCEAAGKAPGLC